MEGSGIDMSSATNPSEAVHGGGPSARVVSLLSLLALVPVFVFAVQRSLIVLIAAINVVLICGSLLALTSPVDEPEPASREPTA